MKSKTKIVIGTDSEGMFCITKKLFTILLFCLCCSCGLEAQTVTTTDGGKTYHSVTKPKQTATGETTGKVFVDSKGASYPILKSERGAYYVERVSKKTNKPYRQYLKL